MLGNNNGIVKRKIIKKDSQVRSSLFRDVMLRNIPEEQRSHVHCSRSLKSQLPSGSLLS
jgi:hypothetical protein